MTTARLRSVKPSQQEPLPDLSYEARERQHIMNRDWAAVHSAADRRAPVFLPERVRRVWRG